MLLVYEDRTVLYSSQKILYHQAPVDSFCIALLSDEISSHAVSMQMTAPSLRMAMDSLVREPYGVSAVIEDCTFDRSE